MSDLRDDPEGPWSNCAKVVAERDEAQAQVARLRAAIREHRESVSLGTSVDDALWAVLNS